VHAAANATIISFAFVSRFSFLAIVVLILPVAALVVLCSPLFEG
jgi:hypothetical protein